MITLLGSLIGFLGSLFPEFLKLWRDKSDKAHELAILDRQMEMQKLGFNQRLEEINAQADIAESAALYKTYATGIHWVDTLNGTVRPTLAYAFFGLYALMKINQIHTTPWLLWTEEDQAIFSGIISFYFGQRAMAKLRSFK